MAFNVIDRRSANRGPRCQSPLGSRIFIAFVAINEKLTRDVRNSALRLGHISQMTIVPIGNWPLKPQKKTRHKRCSPDDDGRISTIKTYQLDGHHRLRPSEEV